MLARSSVVLSVLGPLLERSWIDLGGSWGSLGWILGLLVGPKRVQSRSEGLPGSLSKRSSARKVEIFKFDDSSKFEHIFGVSGAPGIEQKSTKIDQSRLKKTLRAILGRLLSV